jgi:hypothetical protein
VLRFVRLECFVLDSPNLRAGHRALRDRVAESVGRGDAGIATDV